MSRASPKRLGKCSSAVIISFLISIISSGSTSRLLLTGARSPVFAFLVRMISPRDCQRRLLPPLLLSYSSSGEHASVTRARAGGLRLSLRLPYKRLSTVRLRSRTCGWFCFSPSRIVLVGNCFCKIPNLEVSGGFSMFRLRLGSWPKVQSLGRLY